MVNTKFPTGLNGSSAFRGKSQRSVDRNKLGFKRFPITVDNKWAVFIIRGFSPRGEVNSIYD
jgi:hypothetical protein